MERTNALKLRQSLGAVLKRLKRSGLPILVEKDRIPVAVLITIEEYSKRFVDVDADIAREEMVKKIKAAKLNLPKGLSSLDLVRNIRSA